MAANLHHPLAMLKIGFEFRSPLIRVLIFKPIETIFESFLFLNKQQRNHSALSKPLTRNGFLLCSTIKPSFKFHPFFRIFPCIQLLYPLLLSSVDIGIHSFLLRFKLVVNQYPEGDPGGRSLGKFPHLSG